MPADLALTPSPDGSIISTVANPPQGPPPAAALLVALRAAYYVELNIIGVMWSHLLCEDASATARRRYLF